MIAVGKFLISTTTMDPINKVVELENNGSLTQIRVMEEQLVVNTVLRTECACPGCQVETVEAVETSTIHKSQGDSRLQISPDKLTIKLSSQKENGEKIKDKTPRIEEMVEEIVESTSSTVEAVPSLLGPHPTLAGKLLHSVTVNSMQLVPFIGPGCFKQATRGSRTAELFTKKGKGSVTPYRDALMSSLGLPKPPITPQKVNPLIPLISNFTAHNPQNSLSIAPNKQLNTHTSLNEWGILSTLTGKTMKGTNLVDKPTRKQRSIEERLGLSKSLRSKRRGRRGKQRCVVFRSAMAAAAAMSVSTEGIINRNKIVLNESKAAWSVTKILGTDYMGNNEEVISRIMVTDEEVELRSALQLTK